MARVSVEDNHRGEGRLQRALKVNKTLVELGGKRILKQIPNPNPHPNHRGYVKIEHI